MHVSLGEMGGWDGLGLGRAYVPVVLAVPTDDALLTNFRLSSDAGIFVAEHRLGMGVGARRAKTCRYYVYAMCTYSD